MTKPFMIEFDVMESAASTLAFVRAGDKGKLQIEEHVNGQKIVHAKLPVELCGKKKNKSIKKLSGSSTESTSEVSPTSSSNECEPDSEFEAIDPSFLNSLLHPSDRRLLERHDVRDILFAYHALGNFVYVRHISRLLTYMTEWNMDFVETFNISPMHFYKEFVLFAEFQPEFAAEAMSEAKIPNLDFLAGCVAFYERRLMVAHPFIPRLPGIIKPLFKNLVAMLKSSNSDPHPSGSTLLKGIPWGGLASLGPLGKLKAISEEHIRPEGYPKQERIEYIIALLALHEIGNTGQLYKACNFVSTSAWKDVLNEVAHTLDKASYLAGAKTIFNDTEHEKFLNLI
jgi:hypothetical protein